MDFLSVFCSTRFGDPNSAWQMQQKLKEKNEMYKFVDLSMGGSLIEAVSVSPVCPESACQASASVDNILPTTAMSAISLRFQSVRSVSVTGIGPRSACHSINSAGSTDPHPVLAAHSECNSPEFLSTEDLEPDPGVGRVKRIARDELVNYLYEGKSAWITALDYKEWLHKVEDNIQGECKSDVEAWGRFGRVEYKEDAFNRFEPHQACWNLTKRGWMGETPFLLCYFMNTSEHLKVARVLLAEFPEMVLDVYEGREYFGQSALHIVIANGDLESVKLLVQCGADIKQRATGRFFRPDDQKDNPDGDTNYKGSAYYGEYPLAFAASRGDIAIYDFLLENGAEPNMKDSFGNTVLHMAVIHDHPVTTGGSKNVWVMAGMRSSR